MINRRLQRAQRILAFFLCAVVLSCAKDANLVVTTPPAVDSTAVAKYTGSFVNGPYGNVSGTVTVLKQDSAYVLSLKNFSSSSGPDLHVYLSKEQQPVNFIDLGSLRSRTGDQAYRIAGAPNFSEYKFALVHCQAYDHLFGSALLH